MGVAAVIIKRTRGVSAAKALAYDYGPGRTMEHENPRRVAGTVAGRDWRDRSRAMQAKLRGDGDTVKGRRGRVLRLAVSAAPEDRVMSDRDWAEIARRVVGEFTGDADRFAWEAVRHDPRHIHITLLARGHDGRLVRESHDYRRFGRISASIERDYQLRVVDHTPTDTRERKKERSAKRKAAQARQREKAQRVRPVAAGRQRARDTRPHLGWDSAYQAERLGPKPRDFEAWPAERKQTFIRERLREHQQREEQTRGRDGGRER